MSRALQVDSKLRLDSGGESGQPPSAPTPMEVQLVALGACAGMDVISILRKMRQSVTSYDLRLSAVRATEHPQVYTSIDITHVVSGSGLSEPNVHRAIQLSMTRYCPVFAMLYPKVHIIERYGVVDEATGQTRSGDVSVEPG